MLWSLLVPIIHQKIFPIAYVSLVNLGKSSITKDIARLLSFYLISSTCILGYEISKCLCVVFADCDPLIINNKCFMLQSAYYLCCVIMFGVCTC